MAGKRDHRQLFLLVRDRSRIQEIALELLYLIEARGRRKSRRSNRRRYDLLVGITFSLWRAVFLAEVGNDGDLHLSNAEAFLDKVIRHNAISYMDDWNNRSWSFGYYLDNARYRLEEFAKAMPEFELKAKTRETSASHSESKRPPEARAQWRLLCEELWDAINVLRETVATGAA